MRAVVCADVVKSYQALQDGVGAHVIDIDPVEAKASLVAVASRPARHLLRGPASAVLSIHRVGQMVSPAETDRIFYRDTLAWARTSGSTGLVDNLTRSGPPPYSRILDYEPALSYEHEVYPYSHAGNSEGVGGMSENNFVGEYTVLGQLHIFGGFMDTLTVLYSQIQDVDFRTQATTLHVPGYLVEGRHEAPRSVTTSCGTRQTLLRYGQIRNRELDLMSESVLAPRRPGGRGSDRGRPRDPDMDQAILRATVELLSEVGYVRVTVAEVARRAGISKPAIYRRWSQKSQLVVEAMVTQMRSGKENDSGSAAGDLLALTEQLISVLTLTPLGRVLPGLVAEMAADPVLATSYRDLIIKPNQRHWRAAIERGIARGELSTETDVDFVLNTLAGPLYFSLLITGEPIDAGYARAAVDLVWARYGAAAS